MRGWAKWSKVQGTSKSELVAAGQEEGEALRVSRMPERQDRPKGEQPEHLRWTRSWCISPTFCRAALDSGARSHQPVGTAEMWGPARWDLEDVGSSPVGLQRCGVQPHLLLHGWGLGAADSAPTAALDMPDGLGKTHPLYEMSRQSK